MNRNELLIGNIDRIHTTPMGVGRVKRNLKIDTDDAVGYCKDLILNPQCRIARQGKNWYCEIKNIRITVNAYSYTIITAHTIQKIPTHKIKERVALQISQFFVNGDIKGAIASVRIKREFADTDQRSLPCVQTQALTLLHAHTREMEEKYEGQRNE